jgi:hypothetical protein
MFIALPSNRLNLAYIGGAFLFGFTQKPRIIEQDPDVEKHLETKYT